MKKQCLKFYKFTRRIAKQMHKFHSKYFAYDQLPKIRMGGGRAKFYLCILRAASVKHQDPNSASKTERGASETKMQ